MTTTLSFGETLAPRSSTIVLHLISSFRISLDLPQLPSCQSLHSSPVRSLSTPESIAAVLLYLPMLLPARLSWLPAGRMDYRPQIPACASVFFFASLPLLTLTIFATSDLDELNTSHTLHYYTGYRLRSSDLYIVQLKVVGTAVQILASGPQLHPIFSPLIKVRESRPHEPQPERVKMLRCWCRGDPKIKRTHAVKSFHNRLSVNVQRERVTLAS